MSPPYKHSLKCIQVNQIKNNIKGTLEGKEDIISQNDSPKLKDWDVGGGGELKEVEILSSLTALIH